MNERPLVVNEAAGFRVNRATLVDPEILELERRRVFDACWIYVGHESELRSPGDFRTRAVCGRPVIFCRDSGNAVRVFLNTCRHRGAMVCREAEGNAKTYTCFYHGCATTATAASTESPARRTTRRVSGDPTTASWSRRGSRVIADSYSSISTERPSRCTSISRERRNTSIW